MAQEQNYSDEQDIEFVQQGQVEAFQRIVRRYTPVLYSLCYRMLGDQEAAEDAVQEVFVKAYRSISSFDSSRRFYSWIYTIAVNHLRSLNRKYSRKPNPDIPYEESLNESIRRDDKNRAPDTSAIQREGERLAQRALNRLDQKLKEVFVLRMVEGLSVKDTSRTLDIPENTVKTYLRRAREQLIEEMKALGYGEPDGV